LEHPNSNDEPVVDERHIHWGGNIGDYFPIQMRSNGLEAKRKIENFKSLLVNRFRFKKRGLRRLL
jgi:hypothetical protein